MHGDLSRVARRPSALGGLRGRSSACVGGDERLRAALLSSRSFDQQAEDLLERFFTGAPLTEATVGELAGGNVC